LCSTVRNSSEILLLESAWIIALHLASVVYFEHGYADNPVESSRL